VSAVTPGAWLIAVAALAGCGAENGRTRADAPGRVIEVRLVTDDRGNSFEPAVIEAHRGDLLRFTLVSGVHNVHLMAAANGDSAGFPARSELLQAPGQRIEVPVTMAPGRYTFQCDPHSPLGMVGTLTVD
jgi:plastocyanin